MINELSKLHPLDWRFKFAEAADKINGTTITKSATIKALKRAKYSGKRSLYFDAAKQLDRLQRFNKPDQ